LRELYAEELCIAYGDKAVVEGLSLRIPPGEITALVGANGSGKSTILKTMCRIMRPKNGAVYLDGKAIHTLSTKEVARQLAILPQNPEAPGRLMVHELISYGRFPHKKGFGMLTKKDREIIDGTLEIIGMTEFRDRTIDSLSGGQRQKIWIAMALAQETDILFLDEPTTFLDMAHQLEVLQLLEYLNHSQGRTIIMVVHDLNHAARYARYMIAIKKGRILYEGSPQEVMTPEMMEYVFGVKAKFLIDPVSGGPICIPYKLCGRR
jgi:iron complex transport system ATP-binding protein